MRFPVLQTDYTTSMRRTSKSSKHNQYTRYKSLLYQTTADKTNTKWEIQQSTTIIVCILQIVGRPISTYTLHYFRSANQYTRNLFAPAAKETSRLFLLSSIAHRGYLLQVLQGGRQSCHAKSCARGTRIAKPWARGAVWERGGRRGTEPKIRTAIGAS